MRHLSGTAPLRRRPSPADAALVANAGALLVVLLAVVAIDLFAMPFTGFALDSDLILNCNLVMVAVVAPFWAFYTFYRFDTVVFSSLGAACLLAGLIPALCVMTYVACALGAHVPLQDELLASFDERLGFRWPDVLAWADRHPAAMTVGRWAYRSVPFQTLTLLVTLSATRQAGRLQAVIYAFVIAVVLCSAISAIVPALGAYAFYGVSLHDHEHVDLVVRNSTVRGVLALRRNDFGVLSIAKADGIIVFPSFHTVLGVLFVWAFSATPYLRWCALAIDGAMIAATPLQGSHYLADILAGTVTAIVAILISGWLHMAVGRVAERSAAVAARKPRVPVQGRSDGSVDPTPLNCG